MNKKHPTIFEIVAVLLSAVALLAACSNLDLGKVSSLILGWAVGTIAYVWLSI